MLLARRFSEDHNADSTNAVLDELLDRIRGLSRCTLTWDQGSEMASSRQGAKTNGFARCFANFHSTWQRPANEKDDRLIRRYVDIGPDLGSDLATTSAPSDIG